MTLSRERPPFDGDERTQLVGWLDLQRAIVVWKCEGVSEADAHRSVVPTSPLMSLAGIVSHLRWVESTWFEALFLGGDTKGNRALDDTVDNADMLVEGVPLAQLIAEYEAQCARSNEIIAAHSLDTPGRHPDFRSAQGSLRWMLTHMIEETARHAGHMDIIRELLDGQQGYY